MAEVELSRRDAILTVTMNRPEKRNALNGALCRELAADEAADVLVDREAIELRRGR